MKLFSKVLVIVLSLLIIAEYNNGNNIDNKQQFPIVGRDYRHIEPIEDAKTAEENSILSVMFEFQREENNELFLRASPTDEEDYYGWSVPISILNKAFYQGKRISFHWYGYTIGEGEEYEMIECFVNPRGRDLIVFAVKDGQRYVFHNTNRPEGDVFNLELSNNPILNRFMDESIGGQPIEAVRTGRYNSILSTIFSYQKRKKEQFYRLAVGDRIRYNYYFYVYEDILERTHYKGQPISFQWYGETIGEGEEYELIESFVSESGSELIIFAMKDGQRYVFHQTTPLERDVLELKLSEDRTLNRFIEIY